MVPRMDPRVPFAFTTFLPFSFIVIHNETVKKERWWTKDNGRRMVEGALADGER